MTAPGHTPLLGRAEELDQAVHASTCIVTGLPSAGVTSMLSAVARAGHRAAQCVVTAAGMPGTGRIPMGYLAGLTVIGTDAQRVGATPVVTALSTPSGRPTSPLDDLPWIIELAAREIIAAADGRPVLLVLDDLHTADALSLAALPLLQRRLDSRLIGGCRAPNPDHVVRPALKAFVRRLHRPQRVHLSGLNDAACLALARTRDTNASATLVAAVREAIGTWPALPGLMLGIIDEITMAEARDTIDDPHHAPGPRLPLMHPLVRELVQRGAAATVLATAHVASELAWADVEAIGTVLGEGFEHLAIEVDLLTQEGLLDHPRNGKWRCPVPALGRSLAACALPPAVLVALVTAGPSQSGVVDGYRLSRLAARAEKRLPDLLDVLLVAARRAVDGDPGQAVQPGLITALADAVTQVSSSEILSTRTAALTDAALLAEVSGDSDSGRRIASAIPAARQTTCRNAGVERHRAARTARLQAAADTLGAATDGSATRWDHAWRRWERVRGPQPQPVLAPELRALAGWASRSELYARLQGSPVTGPAADFLAGRWRSVAAAGHALLTSTVRTPTQHDLVTAAATLLVALERAETGVARRLWKLLASGPARPPIATLALVEAALSPGSPNIVTDPTATDLLIEHDVHQARQSGPRNGLDLVLHSRARLHLARGRRSKALSDADQLDRLTRRLGSTRAQILADDVRVLLTHPGMSAPDSRIVRLRTLLDGPEAVPALGVLGRSIMLLGLVEHLPRDDERAAVVADASDVLLPLGAAHRITAARALAPDADRRRSGARSARAARMVHGFITDGLTNRQIASRMGLSEKTVEAYVTRLLREHAAANRAELAATADNTSPPCEPAGPHADPAAWVAHRRAAACDGARGSASPLQKRTGAVSRPLPPFVRHERTAQ